MAANKAVTARLRVIQTKPIDDGPVPERNDFIISRAADEVGGMLVPRPKALKRQIDLPDELFNQSRVWTNRRKFDH